MTDEQNPPGTTPPDDDSISTPPPPVAEQGGIVGPVDAAANAGSPGMPTHTRRAAPHYKCHKTVAAAKIARVDRAPERETQETAASGMFKLSFEDETIEPVFVTGDYVHKHAPSPGGYYVLYEDGYHSFSPAEAFENGYTRID